MSDEQKMPDDLVKVNTVGWDADAMQEHVFDCHDAIRTLTVKASALALRIGRIRTLILAANDQCPCCLGDLTDPQKHDAASPTCPLAQLKEQDDE